MSDVKRGALSSQDLNGRQLEFSSTPFIADIRLPSVQYKTYAK